VDDNTGFQIAISEGLLAGVYVSTRARIHAHDGYLR
jgi:hypothetical protein